MKNEALRKAQLEDVRLWTYSASTDSFKKTDASAGTRLF